MINTQLLRWQQLPPSDKRILIGGTFALFLILLWSLVWQPLQSQMQANQQRLVKLKNDYAWMQQAAPQIQALQSQQQPNTDHRTSLLTLIDQSLQKSPLANINKRISPRNEHQAQIDIESVAFNPFISWLSQLLTAEAIQVQSLSIEAGKTAGMVQIHLSLKQ